MAVREFTDERGTRWRAWTVVPESLHPRSKDEDYLADLYQTGWLVFETASGDEKRRLAPFPTAWAELSDAELEQMLARAEAIPGRRHDAERVFTPPATSGEPPLVDVPADEQRPDVTDLQVVRTFRYPGGRFWTVCVIPHPEDGGPPVLRFTAGARYLDLRSWPREWADYPDERLVDLLRAAAPRLATGAPPPGTPGRRWNDPPSTTSAAAT